MIKVSRLVLGGDKPYQGVQLMLPGEMDQAEVDKVLGDDKTVAFSVPGPRRRPSWYFTHGDSLTLIILDDLVRRGGGGVPFERIVVGNTIFGPGTIVAPEQYEFVGVPPELLEANLFDPPLVFVAQEGLIITKAGSVSSLEAGALAPKAKQDEHPPATTGPLLASRSPGDVRGPSLEQVQRAQQQQQARQQQLGGPLRGTGSAEGTYPEVGTDQYGDPVSRDISRPVVRDPGPGREGGPINPDLEFDATKKGTEVGHGKLFGAPAGIAAEHYGEPGAAADRAGNLGDKPGQPARETVPATTAPDRPAPHPPGDAGRPEETARKAAAAKPAATPGGREEEKAKSPAPAAGAAKPAQQAAKPQPEAAKPPAPVAGGAQNTDPANQAQGSQKPPAKTEADAAAEQARAAPTPDPVKVDPAPGQEVKVQKSK